MEEALTPKTQPTIPENPVQPVSAPVPTPPPPIPPAPSPQTVLTPTASGGGPSKFSIFVGLLVFITLGIYTFVGYLYLQNNQLKKKLGGQNSQGQATATATPTPASAINPEEIKIVNGDVVRVTSSGQSTIIISKANYPSTGITGFAKVTVSPDTKMICFESWSPAPEPALYLAAVDGSNLKEVSPNRKKCHWLPTSDKLVYINTSSDSSPVDIFHYDIAQGEEKNLTEGTTEEGFIRFYDVTELAADGSKIVCNYSETTAATEGTTTQGNCEIDLTTLKLTEI